MAASHSSRRLPINPVIESLEIRRMLSADLTGAFAGILPVAIHAGNANHLAVRVVNEGDASARGKVTVDLYAAPFPSEDNDVLLGSATRSVNLKPGKGVNVAIQFADPASLPDGDYSLIASIDSSRIPNVNTTGSTFARETPISVEQPAADLTVEMVRAPGQPIVIDGTDVGAEPAGAVVGNRGMIAARGDVSVSFYLSKDRNLDSWDVPAGTVSDVAINLKPGQRKLFSEELIPPVGTPAGSYYLLAVATPGAGIAQKKVGDETGMASGQVAVVRPAPVAVQPAPTPIHVTPQPPPTAGRTAPVKAGGTTSPTCNDPVQSPVAGDTSTPTCDDGAQGSGDDQQPTTDDGAPASQPSDQGNDGSSQQPPGDSSGDTSQPADSGQDNSTQPSDDSGSPDDGSQDSSTQPTDNSGDQNNGSQDDSSQPTDDSGDQGDSGQSFDSGSDDSGDDFSSDTSGDSDVFDG